MSEDKEYIIIIDSSGNILCQNSITFFIIRRNRNGAKEFVEELIVKARKAQSEYEKFTQEQADEIVRACAKAVYDNAEYLARLAVDETRMGRIRA